MPRATVDATQVELEYETFGAPSDAAVLLVMGLAAQLTSWDEGFCRRLAGGGRYVIRYDNRDCGLSTKYDGATVDLAGLLSAAVHGAEVMPRVSYTLSDMAADAVGLLDVLDIGAAH